MDNSKTYQERYEILAKINELWFQVWEQYKQEDSALDLIEIINEFTNRMIAYFKLFLSLTLINEGKTGEEKADLIRAVEGLLILSETIDVFIDIFADSELQQVYNFAQNALSVSNRNLTKYFQDTETSHLVTQLRAYSSLIILRIQERFNPQNVSPETNSNSLTDDLRELDPWTRNLVGVVDLGSEDMKESYVDYLVKKYQ